LLRILSWSLLLFLMLFSSYVWAQDQPYTPERGTAERQTITDVLRVPVQKQLKKKVIFKIGRLKVQDGWAFLLGIPQQQDGSPMEYRGTVYQDAIDAGAFDDWICALLRKHEGKWQVVTYVIGATDVPYVEWDKKYHAPLAIFKEK
jgi:hypothetical protein